MAKNFLAFLGLVLLTALVLVGVALIGYFYDALGLVRLPEAAPTALARIMAPGESMLELTIEAIGGGEAQWSNPLDNLPENSDGEEVRSTPTMHFAMPATSTSGIEVFPTLAPTPVPPLDADIYQTLVVIELKAFAQTLERWLDANQALGQERSLLADAGWRQEMSVLLDEISDRAASLAGVGPAPQEYAPIAGWLERIRIEAVGLVRAYQGAMETQEAQDFRKAGDHFLRIKEYMGQAVDAMLAHGWKLQ